MVEGLTIPHRKKETVTNPLDKPRIDALITSNENADEVDINDMWKNTRDNIKVAAEESMGYCEVKKKTPWFDDDCSNVAERRKQAKLKFFQDPKQLNRDNIITLKDARPVVHLEAKREII